MNVCIICYYFYPLSAGGGKQMLGLAHALRRKGHDVIFLSADFGKFQKEDSIDGFRLIRVSSSGRGTADLVRYWFNLAKKLIMIRSEYDVILTCELSLYNIIIGCVGKLLGKKSVGRTSMSGEVRSRSYGRFFGLVHRIFLACIDSYIAISKNLFNDLASLNGVGEHNLSLIYNGVNREQFFPPDAIDKKRLKEKLGLDNQKIVLYVGIIDPRKGVHNLIEAWEVVVNTNKNAKLVIIGPMYEKENSSWDSEYYKSILDRLKELGAANYEFLGKMDNINEYMMCADIFVLPSYREGMPNVVIEAMSTGLPVICTNISGCTDLISDNENGYLFTPGDSGMAAKLLGSLINDEQAKSRMGAESINRIKLKHSFDIVADKYLEVFNK